MTSRGFPTILKAVRVFMGRCFFFKILDGPQMVVISYLNIVDWPQNCQLWCGNISVSPFCGVCSKSIEFLEFLKLFEHTPKKPWVFFIFFRGMLKKLQKLEEFNTF